MLSIIELLFDAKYTPANGNISFIIIIMLFSVFRLRLLRELQGDPVYLESGTEKTGHSKVLAHPLIPPQIHVFPYKVLYKVIL